MIELSPDQREYHHAERKDARQRRAIWDGNKHTQTKKEEKQNRTPTSKC
jgi:hypothetical protein